MAACPLQHAGGDAERRVKERKPEAKQSDGCPERQDGHLAIGWPRTA